MSVCLRMTVPSSCVCGDENVGGWYSNEAVNYFVENY